jgi:hypothetical protein
MRLITIALAAFVALSAGVLFSAKASASDAQNGTWKLNTAKSKYKAGPCHRVSC